MKFITRSISTLTLAAFLLNAVSSGAYCLAPASTQSDISGVEHKDIGRIKLALEAALTKGESRDTFYNYNGLQIFYHEAKTFSQGKAIMCRLSDEKGVRTYFAVVGLSPDADGHLPVEVYTEEEYIKAASASSGFPKRSTADLAAIKRYIQHEKGIDTVLTHAHTEGIALEPTNFRYNFKASVRDILQKLNIKVINPAGLTSIEDRKLFLVPLTPDINDLINMLPKARVIDQNGKEFDVTYTAHSSNSAIHLFVDIGTYRMLTGAEAAFDPDEGGKMIAENVTPKLVHEIGVILGSPILSAGNSPVAS